MAAIEPQMTPLSQLKHRDFLSVNAVSSVAQLTAAGRNCLAECLYDLPSEFLDRVRLKLPQEFALNPPPAPSDEPRNTLWKNVRRILLAEINPRLAPCFN